MKRFVPARNLGSRNPWNHAYVEGRDYLTPEDIGAAMKAGVGRVTLFAIVLDAIERRAAEDVTLCAFVALGWKKRKRPAKRTRLPAGVPSILGGAP